MRSRSLAPMIIGAIIVMGAVFLHADLRRMQRDDLREIGPLRHQLDSTRSALTRAFTAADSTRLAESVASRTRMLEHREFHVPSRQETIDGFWGITGAGTVLTLVGVGLIAIGALGSRRRS